MQPIVESSPLAKARITSYEDLIGTFDNTHHRNKYPFDALKIGQSFTLPFDGTKITSLRAMVYQKGETTRKKFAVLKHVEHSLYEVARIA